MILVQKFLILTSSPHTHKRLNFFQKLAENAFLRQQLKLHRSTTTKNLPFQNIEIKFEFTLINLKSTELPEDFSFKPLQQHSLLNESFMKRVIQEDGSDDQLSFFKGKIIDLVYKDACFQKPQKSNITIPKNNVGTKSYNNEDQGEKNNELTEKVIFSSLDPQDIIDLKFKKDKKNIILEEKNKGLHFYDHFFIENSNSCLKFFKKFNPQLKYKMSTQDGAGLVWVTYKFKLSQKFQNNEFWFIENKDYLSLFDNCFYVKSFENVLYTWALIPEHQFLNQQFHIDYQLKIKEKIEKRLDFLSLSNNGYLKESLDLVDSQKWNFNEQPRMSRFPVFDLVDQSETETWFLNYQNTFNKLHKYNKDFIFND